MSTNDETVIGQNNGAHLVGGTEDQGQTSPVTEGFSVDDIMWRVRSEVMRRRNDHTNGVTIAAVPSGNRSFDPSMPRWKPSVPRLPVKSKYHLSELLAFSDADFIDVAFRAILRRPPDEVGFNHYLQVVRGGGAAKILILKDFLVTPEGQSSGVQIEGLYLPTLLEEWRRKRFIGPVVAWVHALLRLGVFADRQATSDANNAREIQELGHLVNKVSQRFETCEERIDRLKAGLDSTTSSVQQLLTRDKHAAEAIRALDPFYAAFEDHFRGDRAVIRTRVEPYLNLVREVGAGTREAPILDVGCGRGEWLELLRDCGLIGRGIEINRVFIDACRGRGLEVLEGDAIASLRAIPDCSAGAITSMHLIEHLPFESAIALLDEVRRVLRPGGLIIIETPNPENLSVGHHWFYMDPTHRNPLPPLALRWIVEARGFHDVRIERLVLAREMTVPPPVPEEAPGADAINALLASMRVAADYAIIGKRP